MTTATTDVVDELVGVRRDDVLDELRRRRPVTRDQLQASYDALFAPVDDSTFAVADRCAFDVSIATHRRLSPRVPPPRASDDFGAHEARPRIGSSRGRSR